jgi:multiple sugar transport system permease protein
MRRFFRKRIDKFKEWKKRHHDAYIAMIILVPIVGWWIIIGGVPTIFGFILGFFRWVGLNASPKFVGFKNYIAFFRDPIYYQSLIRAIWLGGLCTIVTMGTGFIIGFLLNLPIKGKGIYRTIWYIPSVTAVAAITQILTMLLDPNFGIVAETLQKFGLEPINIELSASWGIFVIVIYSLWRGVGGSALLWLAGLQSVDRNLYEAASVDGASGFQQFLYITIPGLKPIAIYAVITGAIGSVQIYEQIAFITGGGPFGQTETVVFRIMQDAFYDSNFGMAGVSSVMVLLVVFAFSIYYFRLQTSDIRKQKQLGKRAYKVTMSQRGVKV